LTSLQAAWRGSRARTRWQQHKTRILKQGQTAGISYYLLKSSLQNKQATAEKELPLAAGHPDTFWRASSNIVVKDTSVSELEVYEELQYSPIKAFIPALYGANDHRACDRHVLLHLEDLTSGYSRPAIMDVKLGTRTFLEKEVAASKPRADLAEKMLKLDPTALSDVEREKGVTKLRYMQFREQRSSSATLGWRIEGWVLPDGDGSEIDFKSLCTPEQLRGTLEAFTRTAPSERPKIVGCLEKLRSILEGEGSQWFLNHEVVSSSLLFVYEGDSASRDDGDGSKAKSPGVYMIDFAKTSPIPEDLGPRSHRAPWVPGNHEDGYLFGLDNLIDMWRGIAAEDAPAMNGNGS